MMQVGILTESLAFWISKKTEQIKLHSQKLVYTLFVNIDRHSSDPKPLRKLKTILGRMFFSSTTNSICPLKSVQQLCTKKMKMQWDRKTG